MNAAIESLRCARMIFSCVDRLKYYLFAMQTVRLLLTLTALISGIPFVTAFKLLLSGLIADLVGVMIAAFEPRTVGVSRPVGGLCLFVQSLASALALYGATILSALFLTSFGKLGADGISTYCLYALLFGGTALLTVSAGLEKGAYFTMRLSNMFAAAILCGAGFILLCNLFPGFGSVFGIVRIGWQAWIGTVCVFIAAFVLATLFRLLFTKIIEKE